MLAPEVDNRSRNMSSSTSVLLTALLSACIAFQLNASMLSPALVTMSDELGTNEAAVGFTQTAFFTASAMFSMFLPRYSDIAGRKRMLQLALLVMLAGSVVAALAPNVAVLFAARAVQGISGPIVGISLLMLRSEVSDPKRLGTMMGVVAAVNGGIAGVDAFAGGWLTANFGFRSLFWVLAPADRPGFLLGLNSAAFGLGSGLSFAILPAVQGSGPSDGGSSGGYVTALLIGMVIVLAAWGLRSFCRGRVRRNKRCELRPAAAVGECPQKAIQATLPMLRISRSSRPVNSVGGDTPRLVVGTPLLITERDWDTRPSGIEIYAIRDLAEVQQQIDTPTTSAGWTSALAVPIAVLLALLAARGCSARRGTVGVASRPYCVQQIGGRSFAV